MTSRTYPKKIVPTAHPAAPRATVVVATRDRPADLRRCLRALAGQAGAPPFEVVVVDDGSRDPVAPLAGALDEGFRTIRLEGGGPARARNAGAAGGAPLLLFTDDDTEVAPDWVAAACAALDARPDALGVEGPVHTPAWDPLHAYSVFSRGPGAYLTCNVAYRRTAFEAAGGFYEAFPFPACEDQDLAFRLLRDGEIAFEPRMAVTHHPRGLRFGQIARRGLLAESDVVLYRRHPDRFDASRGRTWVRTGVYVARFWRHEAARVARRSGPRVRPALRLAALAAAQLACVAVGTARGAARLRSAGS